MWFSTSSGRIELQITKNEARIGYHQGQCDADILALSQTPRIRRQLVKLNPALVRYELREYGTWEEDELMDDAQNLQRLLWIACDVVAEDNY